MLAIPLVLAAFTHLWNPIGFPTIHVDEGHYLKKAIHVVKGLGPQIAEDRYANPFLGQFFMAGIFKIIGYPDSLNPEPGDVTSIEMLYLVPRVLMGLLAVFVTFLIYKIAERRYDRNVAFIASVLFTIMPICLINRRIFLESIQLPLILLAILLAVAVYNHKDKNCKTDDNSLNNNNILTILLSGIFLGLAIFTKIPAFTMIPLVGFLVFTNNNRSWKTLGIWFIPVILIPAIWPAHAMSIGEFGKWIDGIYYQTHRESKPLVDAIFDFFQRDPVLLILGIAGIVLAAIKRNYFLLLWVIPFLIFLYLIGYVSSFHWVPILPALCIAVANLIVYLPKKIMFRFRKKVANEKIIPFAIFLGIGIFGLISTTMLITNEYQNSFFRLTSFIVEYLPDYRYDQKNNVTMVIDKKWIKGPTWIPQYVFHKDYKVQYFHNLASPIDNKKIIFIADEDVKDVINILMLTNETTFPEMKAVYSDTDIVATFYDYETGAVDIRTNYYK